MKKGILITLIFAISIVISSCKKDEKVDESTMKKYSITGHVQKGPFINGSDITISELNSDLTETGRTFNSSIIDDKGTFMVSGIELESSFIKIKADGYFYNEIKGALSDSRIILYAIVDLSTNQAINVNILTSLESERVKYLISSGESFSDAKSQAKSEVYAIFEWSSSQSTSSELCNITEEGEDNSILLAISTIVLGTHSGGEMTSLISTITTDIKEDGQLNNQDAQSKLINEATFLDIENIKVNLISRYSDLGESIEINNFEYYIMHFIDSTDYIFTKNIEYPTQAGSFLNILSDATINYTGGVKYCFAAYLPDGTECRVKYKSRAGGSFGIFPMENNGWTINYPSVDEWWELSVNGDGNIVSIPAMFGPPDSVDVFVYENGANTPIISKVIGY